MMICYILEFLPDEMLGHIDRYGERRRPGQHRLLLASDGVYGFMQFRLYCNFHL